MLILLNGALFFIAWALSKDTHQISLLVFVIFFIIELIVVGIKKSRKKAKEDADWAALNEYETKVEDKLKKAYEKYKDYEYDCHMAMVDGRGFKRLEPTWWRNKEIAKPFIEDVKRRAMAQLIDFDYINSYLDDIDQTRIDMAWLHFLEEEGLSLAEQATALANEIGTFYRNRQKRYKWRGSCTYSPMEDVKPKIN